MQEGMERIGLNEARKIIFSESGWVVYIRLCFFNGDSVASVIHISQETKSVVFAMCDKKGIPTIYDLAYFGNTAYELYKAPSGLL